MYVCQGSYLKSNRETTFDWRPFRTISVVLYAFQYVYYVLFEKCKIIIILGNFSIMKKEHLYAYKSVNGEERGHIILYSWENPS